MPPASDAWNAARLRVLVVHDEELVQLGFRLLLGEQAWVERCLAAPDATTARALAVRWRPDLALVDAGLVGARVANLVGELRATRRDTYILLLANVEAMTRATVRALGADGFMSRRWPARAMLDAMRPELHQAPVLGSRPNASHLSTRQQEILYLIAAGATNAEIARRLYLSPETVKQHTVALYRKLGVHTRMHAVRVARESGLLAA
jgi:DNA-binding NarL/FixJ family response regulator